MSPGKLDVVKKVVEQHKVDPKNEYLRDKNGQSPLDLAMDHMHDYDGCMDVALYLKSRGCGGDEDKPRFLCAACRRGRLGVVKELVEQDKVDPRSVRDSWNWTPLHNPCYRGRKDIVQYLVEKANCDINATDDIDRTTLNIAIQWNFTEITGYLQPQQFAVTGKSDDSRNEDSDDSRNEDSDDSRNEDNDDSRNENSDDSRNEGSDPPTTAKTQKANESMS
ncbi:uncharacterized protein LOC135331395 isoform X2 [Halichondria panicea]|uniref:uncharacterized protein LOC135331395 isoform X2 n=1 Tax=Halichondria panicea TaxID=6063 RepID=UPI00312B5C27